MRQLYNLELTEVAAGTGTVRQDQLDDTKASMAFAMSTFTFTGIIIGALSNGTKGAIVGGLVGGGAIPMFMTLTAAYYVAIDHFLKKHAQTTPEAA